MAEATATGETAVRGPLDARLEDGVLWLTLAAPPANALSIAMIEALQGELDRVRASEAVRVIVIAAQGKVFCAGHDLKEMTAHRADADGGRAFFAHTMALCARLMQTVVRHPRPVIAAVDGMATAAGCQLVASCDLAVAGEAARFATPGVNIGLFCSTPMVALSRNVARKHAMEMLLTGEPIAAERAAEIGLVNRVVPSGSAVAEAGALAERIAGKSPLTLRIGKEAFYEQAEMGLAEAYDHAARVMVENMLARDAEEGIAAFIDKRKPVWRGV
ncbi:enoyl-CoA hydratase [Aquibium sp. A9E412]|uniref:enoyl-CoA hydratase n=1 Tax=Aquibium sp. A9E412 TaxID=2976767 RepID=UPI0025B12958|nr:enoyl-CoA hydratase [Aquibium sp. A9E412]MDN2564924.1 enoyl-CoA hydratase [Aquibium sp. A9E412]